MFKDYDVSLPVVYLTEASQVSEDTKAVKYRVTIITAGKSKNNIVYSETLLNSHASKFEEARVFVASDSSHGYAGSADVRNLIGCIKNVVYQNASLQGELHIVAPNHPSVKHMNELMANGANNLFGLSIVARGEVSETYKNGVTTLNVEAIDEVKSVDLIAIPAAGGKVHEMIEAVSTNSQNHKVEGKMMKDNFEQKKSNVVELGLMTESDVALYSTEASLTEAIKSRVQQFNNLQTKSEDVSLKDITEAQITSLHGKIVSQYGQQKLTESCLCEDAKEVLARKFENHPNLTESVIDQEIEDALKLVSSVRPSIKGHHFSEGETRGEKTTQMLEAVLDGQYSLKEAYRSVTGDHDITGLDKSCDQTLMAEALSVSGGSFSKALGNAMHKKVLKNYESEADFDGWKNFAQETHASDFRDLKVISIGGYGELPKVAESASYQALASPGDQEASYAVEKHGGTETVTIEMIANDDVRSIAQIPRKLAHAAKRTLSHAVFGTINTNPTIFDNKNLWHEEHHNLGTVALDADGLYHMRTLLMQQKGLSNDVPMFAPPKILVVPIELERTAHDLFRRDTNNDSNFINQQMLNIVVNPFQQDRNNWALFADKIMSPVLEVAYYKGQKNPQLYVQDMANVGSLFNNDTITYKIQHIWGVGIVDYRGTVKSVVA